MSHRWLPTPNFKGINGKKRTQNNSNMQTGEYVHVTGEVSRHQGRALHWLLLCKPSTNIDANWQVWLPISFRSTDSDKHHACTVGVGSLSERSSKDIKLSDHRHIAFISYACYVYHMWNAIGRCREAHMCEWLMAMISPRTNLCIG